MQHFNRILNEQVDETRLMRFSLPVLRSAVVLPLKPTDDLMNPVAVAVESADTASWPWELLDDCRREFGAEVEPILVPKDAILMALNQAFDMASASAEQMLENLEDEEVGLAKEIEEIGDLLESEDDAPVIRLVNTLLSQALKDRASDIHIEPFENNVLVRFRIDGVLHSIVSPPKRVQSAMASRIKVMAGLDIAEKRHPQDGRFRVKVAGREVDVRVSVLPTAHGERVVMRLLDKQAGRLNMTHLGLMQNDYERLTQLVHRPHGIILVTGPTGSGKTTTLYAALSDLNDNTRNILTAEDPIEYQLEGIGQTQVNTKVDMTFARALKAMLRQDPDVVMVGEIRDLETAEIAVQSSLTGHMVLSTLHTNSAVGAVTRLRDMGVEPFLLSSTLLGVLAQRLVRRLCSHCKKPYQPNEVDVAAFGFSGDELPNIYSAEGCDQCNQHGYYGRTGIYELICVDKTMQTMIHDGASEQELERYARKSTPSIRDDGMRLVLAGVTSLEEILRVTKED